MGGAVSSIFTDNGRGTIVVPQGYVIPPFPSLYPPSLDNTESERGIFLYEAESIWRFTLYWTIILVGGTFFIGSIWASINLFFSIAYIHPRAIDSQKPQQPINTNGRLTRRKRKPPPLWPLLVLPVVIASIALVVSLISGSVIGFALAAVYSAGGFTMSTWVPFLWGCIQVVVLIISSYSTLTSIL